MYEYEIFKFTITISELNGFICCFYLGKSGVVNVNPIIFIVLLLLWDCFYYFSGLSVATSSLFPHTWHTTQHCFFTALLLLFHCLFFLRFNNEVNDETTGCYPSLQTQHKTYTKHTENNCNSYLFSICI